MDALNATSFASFNQTKDYFVVLEEVSKYNVQLNMVEKLWAAWYLWMQNDTLATGIMSFVLHELVYFGRCIPFMLMDFIPYFQQFRIQKQKIPTIKEQWDCAAIVLISHFTAELPQIWFFHPIATYLGMDYGVPFPPVWKMALQIAICFVMEDAWHYWFHRALHYGPLYKAIHKMHHTYSAPFGLAAEYASPIETALSELVSLDAQLSSLLLLASSTSSPCTPGSFSVFSRPSTLTAAMTSPGVCATSSPSGLVLITTIFTTRSSSATTPPASPGGTTVWIPRPVPTLTSAAARRSSLPSRPRSSNRLPRRKSGTTTNDRLR
ncbi:hypothetical protein NXS19_013307 [Fusarium pseudograminearum]|nr:hypothetical protein NXS19_013307 [Fusarium pseudograminearum]